MKINGVEQVNIRTKENPFWVPKVCNFNIGIDPINREEPSKAAITIIKGGKYHHYTQNKNESFQELCKRVDKEIKTL